MWVVVAWKNVTHTTLIPCLVCLCNHVIFCGACQKENCSVKNSIEWRWVLDLSKSCAHVSGSRSDVSYSLIEVPRSHLGKLKPGVPEAGDPLFAGGQGRSTQFPVFIPGHDHTVLPTILKGQYFMSLFFVVPEVGCGVSTVLAQGAHQTSTTAVSVPGEMGFCTPMWLLAAKLQHAFKEGLYCGKRQPDTSTAWENGPNYAHGTPFLVPARCFRGGQG